MNQQGGGVIAVVMSTGSLKYFLRAHFCTIFDISFYRTTTFLLLFGFLLFIDKNCSAIIMNNHLILQNITLTVAVTLGSKVIFFYEIK